MNDRRNELALIRQQQLGQLRQTLGQPERMVLRFACAARDRDQQMNFTRMPPATRFTCETVVEPNGAPVTKGAVGKPAKTLRVPADQIDMPDACAWCAASNAWIFCDRCGAFVCGAKVGNGRFTCRPSCGRSSRIGPLQEVAGTKSETPGRTAIGHAAMKLLGGRRG